MGAHLLIRCGIHTGNFPARYPPQLIDSVIQPSSLGKVPNGIAAMCLSVTSDGHR